MTERAAWTVELGLGGSYREAVMATAGLAGYWPMDEWRGTSADDLSTLNHNGTYVNTPTLGVLGPCPEGGTAAVFLATESMDVADSADHRPANLSVELWVYPTQAGTDRTILLKANNTLTNGYGFFYTSTNLLAFYVGGLATFVFTTVTLNTWTHLVATYDATNLRLYKNGVLVNGPTAGPGAIVHSSTSLRVGTHASLAASLLGGASHIAVYNTVLSAATALAHYTAGAWTDVSDDWDAEAGMTISRGTPGSTPNDRMAGTGTATFALQNHTGNSAGLQGYYSPVHASCRSGFTFGVPVRISAGYSSTYPQFRGKIHGISPDTGKYRTQLTHCTAHDVVRDLATQRARQVDLQVDESEDVLLYELLESMPFDARPVAVAIDVGLDTYPYAFDDLGSGRAVQAVAKDVAVSAQGLITVNGDGTFVYRNRQSLALLATVATIDDSIMTDLSVPSDLSLVFNRVRVMTHPKLVDAAATTVLWAQEGTAPSVPAAGGTLELWGDYRNPNSTQQLIGGTAMVVPSSGTDFIANSQADGLGSNLTASVTVTATYFASTVKLLLTNNHATLTAFFTTLQVRGKGVYDPSPVTVESSSDQLYGDRLLELDLTYQDDANVAQGLADAIEMQYNDLTGQAESFSMNPQRSPTEMVDALIIGFALGLPLALTETVSGLSAATVMVRSMDLEIQKGGWFTATFGVTPRTSSSIFVLDVSELDDPEDVLSYA